MSKRGTPKRKAGPVTAFAPATVANVAVGFDVLGFALQGIGDRVTVSVDSSTRRATLDAIGGVVDDLPMDPGVNTATVALQALIDELALSHGFRLTLHKGIPLGSGMGGSAASAVGAVVAANRLLDVPLNNDRLLPFALAGEAAASGAPHADNAAPCLLGGLTAVVAEAPVRVVPIPIPPGLSCVLVRPALRVDTRAARGLLRREIPLRRHVEQSMRLTGFLAGCYSGDVELLSQSMVDLIAGPQRAPLITGFDEVRRGALAAGALGCAIAGSGPSVFAWTPAGEQARSVERAMLAAFADAGVEAVSWVSPLGCPGAGVVAAADGSAR